MMSIIRASEPLSIFSSQVASPQSQSGPEGAIRIKNQRVDSRDSSFYFKNKV